MAENAQPLVLSYIKGSLALAHNGNLMNTPQLKWELIQNGAVFHTTTDSEVIAFHIARERVHTRSVEEAVKKTVKRLKGAYGLVVMSPRKLIAVRDPYGLKPPLPGQTGQCVYHRFRKLCPACGRRGLYKRHPAREILTITGEGMHSEYFAQEKAAHCIFEYIYFARLDSVLDGVNVYDARIRGRPDPCRTYPVAADLVAGVPDSGIPAAKGYAEESGIPFGFAFYKNSYIGRTFIKPTQKEREAGVRQKLSVLSTAVKGKRIVLVDDSIVRGTTMANLIHMLKKAGALEVHVRICAPPFLYPCYYGTDVPSNDQLIASCRSTEDIKDLIGADSLGYMRREDLKEMVQGLPLCRACFDGDYPVKPEKTE